ncbi:restriction endonuclease subunit S [Oceanidesulfovibrio indonesiensis]|uniref:Restriction endonuclease subunit S n=1 Tax=Oceanidesulfovibrio indonesiensis TaxID=54767 RepID=A0A7M3M9Y5_9BACT|nr:restriction endonuclease subunit S [Oceanidesulfovibrio indonesiensis]TVM14020.1 restriction endonuclease subunit S [Oceanidesulfovibrio indonesiensis]
MISPEDGCVQVTAHNIPASWSCLRLSHFIANLDSGVSVNGNGRPAAEGEQGVLKVSSVTLGYFNPRENKLIKDEDIKRSKTSPKTGAIIISRSNTPSLVGASAFIDKDYPNLFLPDKLWQTVYCKNVSFSKKWLAYYLACEYVRFKLTSFATGSSSSMCNITKSELLSLPVYTPPLSEQKAIADILSTWDRAIEKTEALIAAKERRKKGLMQQLLTGRVRFGEFAGQEWQEKPLGALFEEVKDVVGEKDIPPYSISAGIGFVSQREKWGKDIAGRQYSKYTHLRKGEFAYNKGNSKRYQCGCAYLVRESDEISVPNVFISFRKKHNNICADFYEHFFIANYHSRELKKYITSGARSDGLLNLNKKDFFKILVPCPLYAEQKAIADVLNKSVAEIEAHQKQLSALKEQKKGLMQQLLTGKMRVKGV